MWIERLVLTDFRNHERLSLTLDRRPVVLAGANGAGKTNVLEAVSLLTAGQGLRRAAYTDIARRAGTGAWSVAATVKTAAGRIDIGTGLAAEPGERSGRIVRINGETQSGSGALAEHVEMVWLTPAMDGLFMGPASERRRFLDRLVLCFDPAHALRAGQFERAMRQRNRLLEDGVRDPSRFAGLEMIMAATGVAIAAARAQAVAAIAAVIRQRRDRHPDSAFPWASLLLDGTLERDVARAAAVDVEDRYARDLSEGRERDRAAGRTLTGPHRSDLLVGHGEKDMPAAASSTGEQKALLIGLVLAHAELIRARRGGPAPILLLDEVAAHLDERRRAALFAEILALGSQAWMTGTDQAAFASLLNDAQYLRVEDGRILAAA
jgi:DNA replication and repair protein RecF